MVSDLLLTQQTFGSLDDASRQRRIGVAYRRPTDGLDDPSHCAVDPSCLFLLPVLQAAAFRHDSQSSINATGDLDIEVTHERPPFPCRILLTQAER